mgnify:CR=1 FL=1
MSITNNCISFCIVNNKFCANFHVNWPLQLEDVYSCFYNAAQPVYFVPRDDSSGLKSLSECASFQTDKTWLEIR